MAGTTWEGCGDPSLRPRSAVSGRRCRAARFPTRLAPAPAPCRSGSLRGPVFQGSVCVRSENVQSSKNCIQKHHTNLDGSKRFQTSVWLLPSASIHLRADLAIEKFTGPAQREQGFERGTWPRPPTQLGSEGCVVDCGARASRSSTTT